MLNGWPVLFRKKKNRFIEYFYVTFSGEAAALRECLMS